MRLEESAVIKEILAKYQASYPFKSVINLGSGDVHHLLRSKPWVKRNVFEPLLATGASIINVDAFGFPGVDLVQDLSLPNGLGFVDGIVGPRLFILANVLEHIPNFARDEFLNKIYLKMDKGDALIVTVPNDYPYHADPIDTMYRPHPDEIAAIIPLDWLERQLIVSGSYKEEFMRMSLFKRIRKLLKPLWILQKPTKWLENHRLLYLFKPYKISIAFGVK
jgi:hypothetical protein